jgi:hypothetical protein
VCDINPPSKIENGASKGIASLRMNVVSAILKKSNKNHNQEG